MPKRQRYRIDIEGKDMALLAAAAGVFGLSQSEFLRRIIRAAMDAGPALSAENAAVMSELSGQVRAVGRNLAQVVRAINAGHAVRIEEIEPVIRQLHERIADMDDELTAMTVAYGSKLRRVARLEIGGRPA